MDPHSTTTPFGRRPFTLAMLTSQNQAKDCPPRAAVHKWEIFRAVCEGRQAIGASERSLSVLNALLTFHPETVLTGDGDLVVFPSNLQLALRAHGMAPATLRRHLAVLVDCGLLIRRDSPNGKRYARKGQGGQVEKAFGFDLTPLVARAAEILAYAEAVRTERRAVALARERLTLRRRDIAKMIAMGMEDAVPADWIRMLTIYRGIVARIPRTAPSSDYEPLIQELDLLAEEVLNALEVHVNFNKTSANESRNEHHKQNSKTKSQIEFEKSISEKETEQTRPQASTRDATKRSFPLPLVLDACPDIVDYAKDGISSWRDLVATANLVRSMLGISPSAWQAAQDTFGPEDAAVVIAAILQRSDGIKSPGGYIRGLTEKMAAGQFSLGPMVMALLRARTIVPRRA